MTSTIRPELGPPRMTGRFERGYRCATCGEPIFEGQMIRADGTVMRHDGACSLLPEERPLGSSPLSDTADRLVALSQWIDEGNAHRDPEAVTWGRIAKVSEEQGEVIAAFIGATGQNPRKGITADGLDVVQELLDVAITALGAVEHMTNHQGKSMTLLHEKVANVCRRAGLSA